MNELNVPIYIVDDDQSVREALRYMLEGYDFTVFDYASGDEFLAQTAVHSEPGCLILDSKRRAI